MPEESVRKTRLPGEGSKTGSPQPLHSRNPCGCPFLPGLPPEGRESSSALGQIGEDAVGIGADSALVVNSPKPSGNVFVEACVDLILPRWVMGR